jgi:hypothetical protein
MAKEKRGYVFTSETALNLPVEARAANALESIAHYLDLIETHLEKLADHAEGLGRLGLDLKSIEGAIRQKP